jgi:hypothetical protein
MKLGGPATNAAVRPNDCWQFDLSPSDQTKQARLKYNATERPALNRKAELADPTKAITTLAVRTNRLFRVSANSRVRAKGSHADRQANSIVAIDGTLNLLPLRIGLLRFDFRPNFRSTTA